MLSLKIIEVVKKFFGDHANNIVRHMRRGAQGGHNAGSFYIDGIFGVSIVFRYRQAPDRTGWQKPT